MSSSVHDFEVGDTVIRVRDCLGRNAPKEGVEYRVVNLVGTGGVQVEGCDSYDYSRFRKVRSVDRRPGLGNDPAARKQAPMFRGLLGYFPNALAEVSNVSLRATAQHNPGEPMHWAWDKSTDEGDCLVRHQARAGQVDTDGIRESAKVAWRALAQLERELLEADPTLQPGVNVRGFTRGGGK